MSPDYIPSKLQRQLADYDYLDENNFESFSHDISLESMLELAYTIMKAVAESCENKGMMYTCKSVLDK